MDAKGKDKQMQSRSRSTQEEEKEQEDLQLIEEEVKNICPDYLKTLPAPLKCEVTTNIMEHLEPRFANMYPEINAAKLAEKHTLPGNNVLMKIGSNMNGINESLHAGSMRVQYKEAFDLMCQDDEKIILTLDLVALLNCPNDNADRIGFSAMGQTDKGRFFLYHAQEKYSDLLVLEHKSESESSSSGRFFSKTSSSKTEEGHVEAKVNREYDSWVYVLNSAQIVDAQFIQVDKTAINTYLNHSSSQHHESDPCGCCNCKLCCTIDWSCIQCPPPWCSIHFPCCQGESSEQSSEHFKLESAFSFGGNSYEKLVATNVESTVQERENIQTWAHALQFTVVDVKSQTATEMAVILDPKSDVKPALKLLGSLKTKLPHNWLDGYTWKHGGWKALKTTLPIDKHNRPVREQMDLEAHTFGALAAKQHEKHEEEITPAQCVTNLCARAPCCVICSKLPCGKYLSKLPCFGCCKPADAVPNADPPFCSFLGKVPCCKPLCPPNPAAAKLGKLGKLGSNDGPADEEM